MGRLIKRKEDKKQKMKKILSKILVCSALALGAVTVAKVGQHQEVKEVKAATSISSVNAYADNFIKIKWDGQVKGDTETSFEGSVTFSDDSVGTLTVYMRNDDPWQFQCSKNKLHDYPYDIDITVGGTDRFLINVTAQTTFTFEKVITPLTSLDITGSEAELDVGESVQLGVTCTPADATYKDVEWTSSNEAVATVSSTGYLTAIAAGETTITVTSTHDGEIHDSFNLTVVDNGPAISLGAQKGTYYTESDMKEQFTITGATQMGAQIVINFSSPLFSLPSSATFDTSGLKASGGEYVSPGINTGGGVLYLLKNDANDLNHITGTAKIELNHTYELNITFEDGYSDGYTYSYTFVGKTSHTAVKFIARLANIADVADYTAIKFNVTVGAVNKEYEFEYVFTTLDAQLGTDASAGETAGVYYQAIIFKGVPADAVFTVSAQALGTNPLATLATSSYTYTVSTGVLVLA